MNDKFHIKCYYCKNYLDLELMHGTSFVQVDGEKIMVHYHYKCKEKVDEEAQRLV